MKEKKLPDECLSPLFPHSISGEMRGEGEVCGVIHGIKLKNGPECFAGLGQLDPLTIDPAHTQWPQREETCCVYSSTSITKSIGDMNRSR